MLTSLMSLITHDSWAQGWTQRKDRPRLPGRTTYRIPGRGDCTGSPGRTMLKSKKRNSRECRCPCKGWEKLASSGKRSDSRGLEGSVWLVEGMRWDWSREQRWDPELRLI